MANIKLPIQYQWLDKEPGPKMLIEALKLVNTKEVPGAGSNKEILSWANELGLSSIYKTDSIAWCGLAIALVARRAGKTVSLKSWDVLRALKWVEFGSPVSEPMLGDVLVFKREGGGHVGLYVGEDSKSYHVLGGNQSDQFGFTRIAKTRLFAARRPEYKIGTPSNIRKVHLVATGQLSLNEA